MALQLNPQIRKLYEDFLASAAGEHYIENLNLLIDGNHQSSENNPDNSRDYAQRAKGVREAKEMLISAGVQLKVKEKRVR